MHKTRQFIAIFTLRLWARTWSSVTPEPWVPGSWNLVRRGWPLIRLFFIILTPQATARTNVQPLEQQHQSAKWLAEFISFLLKTLWRKMRGWGCQSGSGGRWSGWPGGGGSVVCWWHAWLVKAMNSCCCLCRARNMCGHNFLSFLLSALPPFFVVAANYFCNGADGSWRVTCGGKVCGLRNIKFVWEKKFRANFSSKGRQVTGDRWGGLQARGE